MNIVHEQPCGVAAFLEDRERRLRAKVLSATPLVAGCYGLAAGELRMVRFEHTQDCPQCLRAESSPQAAPLTASVSEIVSEVRA